MTQYTKSIHVHNMFKTPKDTHSNIKYTVRSKHEAILLLLLPLPVNSGYRKSWGSLLRVTVVDWRTSSGGVYTGTNITMDSSTIGISGEGPEQATVPKH